MAFLNDEQVASIKEHMLCDSKLLAKAYLIRKKTYEECSVSFNEAEIRKNEGWEEIGHTKTRAKLQKPKPIGTAFEDKIWCMFYNLGFRILNRNENLTIQWGHGNGDHKQIDVVAVNDEAIFVVECKAASKNTAFSFKSAIDEIESHKEGVIKSLRQVYGDKKVKFILATDNYIVGDEDIQRLQNRKIFLLNNNAYKYINSLITSYKATATYQFFGLMFKNELISSSRVRIPALKGKMGSHDYYMMSIEPETLLKMGFVLHRTKVNDSMAPTYQRLLSASRLPGITKFIQTGGYFPNSLIVNFDTKTSGKMSIQFDRTENSSDDSKSQIGMLSIPNAYGIAYIIDGQHRLYGYAGTDYSKTNTIPVVAFINMESSEQLKIFIDINENQKAVKKSLRLDLEEDIYWESPQLLSRMKALRSSIVKSMATDSSSVLSGKISVGEDTASISADYVGKGLLKSTLLPKVKGQVFEKDTEVCMYNIKNQDSNKAMLDCRKAITVFLRECFNYLHRELDEMLFNDFISVSRGVYATIALIGTLNKYLVEKGTILQFAGIEERIAAIKPYLDILCNYLSNLPDIDENELRLIRGQQAETMWMCRFQKCINDKVKDYNPDGLDTWLIGQDTTLQQKGKEYYERILNVLKVAVLEKLQHLYTYAWESQVNDIKNECIHRVLDIHADEEDFDLQSIEWWEGIELTNLKTIIERYWSETNVDDPTFVPFKDEYAIKVNDNFKTKTDKLCWINDLIKLKKIIENPKGKKLTLAQVDELELIHGQLSPDA